MLSVCDVGFSALIGEEFGHAPLHLTTKTNDKFALLFPIMISLA